MKLTVTHQEKYSRGQLLLRTFFGMIYIGIPHYFLLAIVGIWAAIISFLTFWVVLFTGKFPESFFKFQIGYNNWSLRVQAVLGRLHGGLDLNVLQQAVRLLLRAVVQGRYHQVGADLGNRILGADVGDAVGPLPAPLGALIRQRALENPPNMPICAIVFAPRHERTSVRHGNGHGNCSPEGFVAADGGRSAFACVLASIE